MARKEAVARKDAYHHGDLRAQLLRATQSLIEERGPDRFSVADACRLAGVSTAAPYRHFETKDDMLVEAALDGVRRKLQKMEAAASRHEPGTLDALWAVGVAYVEFAMAEPGLFRLMFSRAVRDEPQQRVSTTGDKGFCICAEHVAIFFGCDPEDPLAIGASFALWTVVHGIAFLAIDGMLEKIEDHDLDYRDVIWDTGKKILTR